MSNPLPGMPVRLGDPGVFVCGPEDIAPWESEKPRQRGPAPRRASTGPQRWIVLRDCPDCLERWEWYCEQHNPTNWWLENFRPGQRR